jgi:hypothetical protein
MLPSSTMWQAPTQVWSWRCEQFCWTTTCGTASSYVRGTASSYEENSHASSCGIVHTCGDLLLGKLQPERLASFGGLSLFASLGRLSVFASKLPHSAAADSIPCPPDTTWPQGSDKPPIQSPGERLYFQSPELGDWGIVALGLCREQRAGIASGTQLPRTAANTGLLFYLLATLPCCHKLRKNFGLTVVQPVSCSEVLV